MSMATAISFFVFLAAVTAQDQWTRFPAPTHSDVHVPPSPSPRFGHAMAYDSARGVVVLFGGTHATTNTLLDDTWAWDGIVWRSRPTGLRPPARYRHAMAFDAARGVVVLFGGLNHQSARFPDTWEWDGTTWSLRHNMGTNQERHSVAMAYDSTRRRTIRFGGGGAGGLWGDTWAWNGSTWTVLATTGPPPRFDAQLAYDSIRDRMVLYAGEGQSGYLQDTWEYDGSTWLVRQPARTPPMRARYAMALDAAVARTVVYGGLTTSTATWAWDGNTWTARPTSGGPPPARTRAAMVYDSQRDRVVLFGGDYTNDDATWEYAAPVVAQAAFTPYGAGCSSSVGPMSLQAAAGSLPFVGTPFRVEIGPVPTGLFNIPFALLSASRTSWAGFTLPFDLTPFQMGGCQLLAGADVALQVPRVGATAVLTLAIPYSSALTGSQFYVQGLVTDAAANQGGIAWSNGGEALVGER